MSSFLLRVTILLVCSLSAWGFSLVQAEPLKLGAVLLLSGEYAPQGQAFLSGLELAIEEQNAKGGIGDRTIELIAEDSEFNFPKTTSVAKKLLNLDKVSALFAMTYSETALLAPIASRAQVPLISLWDSSPKIESMSHFVFGVGPWTPSVGETAAEFSRTRLKAKSAAIIGTEDEWSHSIGSFFRESFEKRGGKVLAEYWQNPKDSDFRTLILNVSKLDIDVIYTPVALNIPAFYRQLANAKFSKPAITADVLSEHMIAQIGTAAEGLYQTELATPKSNSMTELLERFRHKSKKECGFPSLLALGYDGGLFAIAGLRSALTKKDEELPGSLASHLLQVNQVPGIFGPMTPNAHGSVRRNVSMFQVRNGSLVEVE